MKKQMACILAAALLAGLCASCGQSEKPDNAATDAALTSQTESVLPSIEAETSVPEQTQTDAETEESAAEEVFGDATVSVRKADGTVDESAADFFDVMDDGVQTQIVFTTDAAVRDFKVLALSDPDFGEDEKMHFTTEVLYEQPRLTPERPLIVQTVFYGDLPNNGISYVDKDGVTRTFSVDLSGEDGSLILTEIT